MYLPRLIIATAIVLAGCVAPVQHNRETIMKRVMNRVESPETRSTGDQTTDFVLPPNINVDDGISENEAASIAIWNNASFQATLTDLDFARADLIESGLLRNPTLSLLLPTGPKQLEAALSWSLDTLWKRRRRQNLSLLNVDRIAQDLVNNGLALVRDTKLAYIEADSTYRQVQLVENDFELLSEIVEIAEKRYRAGDISERDVDISKIELARAQDSLATLRHELAAARATFLAILGNPTADYSDKIAHEPVTPPPAGQVEELITLAMASRPDLRAAEIAIELKSRKLGLEKWKIYDLIGRLDAKEKDTSGFDVRPGFEFELPIFNRNEAGINRAKAELEQAARRYTALRRDIDSQVRDAWIRFQAAADSRDHWRLRVSPEMDDAVARVQYAYDAGEVSYLEILETKRRQLALQLQENHAGAELQRAAAQLNYSVGGNYEILAEN